jgi:hypothetical protein
LYDAKDKAKAIIYRRVEPKKVAYWIKRRSLDSGIGSSKLSNGGDNGGDRP